MTLPQHVTDRLAECEGWVRDETPIPVRTEGAMSEEVQVEVDNNTQGCVPAETFFAYSDKVKGLIAGILIGCQDWAADEDNMMHDSVIQPFIDASRFLGVDFSFSTDRSELKQLVARAQQEGGTK